MCYLFQMQKNSRKICKIERFYRNGRHKTDGRKNSHVDFRSVFLSLLSQSIFLVYKTNNFSIYSQFACRDENTPIQKAKQTKQQQQNKITVVVVVVTLRRKQNTQQKGLNIFRIFSFACENGVCLFWLWTEQRRCGWVREAQHIKREITIIIHAKEFSICLFRRDIPIFRLENVIVALHSVILCAHNACVTSLKYQIRL